MGLHWGLINSLFQHWLGITWELFPSPNLRYYFGKWTVPKFNSKLDPSLTQVRTNINPILKHWEFSYFSCVTNDEEEASDNDTTNDNNLKELIQSINSGIFALSPPPSIPLLVLQQPRNIQEQSTQQSHIAALHKKPHCRKCGHPKKGQISKE